MSHLKPGIFALFLGLPATAQAQCTMDCPDPKNAVEILNVALGGTLPLDGELVGYRVSEDGQSIEGQVRLTGPQVDFLIQSMGLKRTDFTYNVVEKSGSQPIVTAGRITLHRHLKADSYYRTFEAAKDARKSLSVIILPSQSNDPRFDLRIYVHAD